MVGALTPKIMGLLAMNSDPITIYINSSGGVLVCARMIEDLLKTPSMDGDDRRGIGVGVGFSSSAAADLLIGCHYAIVYPSCQILCHGARFETSEPVTLEHADRFTRDLKKEDEERALHLAPSVFDRILFRFDYLTDDFDSVRKDYNDPKMSNLQAYVEAIGLRVSNAASTLLAAAYTRQDTLAELAATVFADLPTPQKESERIQWERKVLDKLVEFEVGRNAKNLSWSLARGGLDQIVMDFRMLQQAADNLRAMQDLLTKFRKLFVSEQEEIDMRKRSEPPEVIEGEINDLAALRMEPLWRFAFFLCQVLMEKDNPLSPEDAFWLGLIDEIAGNEELPTLRKALEEEPQTEPEQLNLPVS